MQSYREGERTSFHQLFHSANGHNSLDRSRSKSRAQNSSRVFQVWQKYKHLDHLPVLSQVHYLTAGSEMEQPEVKLAPKFDANIAGGILTPSANTFNTAFRGFTSIWSTKGIFFSQFLLILISSTQWLEWHFRILCQALLLFPLQQLTFTCCNKSGARP